MRIIKYPKGIINNAFECSNCGTVFVIEKRDMCNNNTVGVLFGADETFTSVKCPCCGTYSKAERVEHVADQIYNSVVDILKDVAEDVKEMDDKQLRAEVATIVDKVYSEIEEGRKAKKWLS